MWALIVPDEEAAVAMEWVRWPERDYKEHPYVWIKDFGYMTWSSGLSGYPVAFNTWAYANRWDMRPPNGDKATIIADDSKRPLSKYQGSPWIYANTGPDYRTLIADLVTA
jgi:hypothetical protein